MKVIFALLFAITFRGPIQPPVKVAGALQNIMVKGDLSQHINLDTLDKKHLFGLGPVAGLKGEIMILDGSVYTSTKDGIKLLNQQDSVSTAAMLVYSRVKDWKTVTVEAGIHSYAELEKWVEITAKANGYDVNTPFAFKIEAAPRKMKYHVIDWQDGVVHTMDNHKQFAVTGEFDNRKAILLGFYSQHHRGIFTHHTSFMHVHLLEIQTRTVGHLDDIILNGPVQLSFPQ